MTKYGLAVLAALAVATLCSLTSQHATARSQYKSAFTKKYAGEDADDAFKQLVKKSSCSVCHNPNCLDEKGKQDKTQRNAYGQALAKLLSEDDKKNKEKINAALETVGKEKSGDGISYAELFKSGKLPENPMPEQTAKPAAK